ncbi:MAG: hypothetical protein QOH21_1808, partial [Acidobacteriota bacterium]|nr:hypothetical protein [Acidobacteriota bacterium]
MIAALLTVVIACAAGYPLARWTDRTADLPRRLGEAYLLGLGVLALVMFVASGHWSRMLVIAVTAVLVAGIALLCHPERRARDLGGRGAGS